MPTLKISNFGPITHFEGDIDDFVILIGPQASGKSTITKVVYFFKMLPHWLAVQDVQSSSDKNLYPKFISLIRERFINLFGPIGYQKSMQVKYSFAPNLYCKIYNERGLVRFNFSNEIKRSINIVLKDKLEESKKNEDDKSKYEGIVNSRVKIATKTTKNYLEQSKNVFITDQTPFFIPAGRSLITLLSSQVGKIQHDERDFVMADFLETIRNIRPHFHGSLEEVENIARGTREIEPDPERAKLARVLINKVLRGKYSFESGEERIYHESGYTKLSFASSGQQESVWILLMAYLLILERESIFIVFEEPEAHLYPEGQDTVIRLISLLYGANSKNNIIITTHSPYVLSSANNLIYASNVSRNNRSEIEKIIPKKIWLPFENVNTYLIDHECSDIIDYELKMIKAEIIDSASALLNEEYDRMHNYE